MIRFGVRLAVAGGREALTRLVIIAAAVGLGVGLLLTTLAAINGVDAQNGRYAWLNSGHSGTAATGGQPLLWQIGETYYRGATIGRVDMAATGPGSPVPPGIPRVPAAGEYYVSPALRDLLRSAPADQLADRFPGHDAGLIGASALPAPNSLLIIVGHAPAELSGAPDIVRVDTIETVSPSDCGGCDIGTRAAGMDLILGVVAGALIFPLLMFVGTATRLAAARREQRLAAMRLVGATPRQVSVLSAVDATVSALAGTALGFALFFLFRDRMAAIPFTGAPFYPADLSLNALDVLAVALGIPLAAAVAARLALRRVHISPLGVARRVTPRPPRAWRLVPLAVGLAELAYFVVAGVPEGSVQQVEVFLPGFLMVMSGLVIAGPWLTMVGARVLARRTSRPATLIAARRLADNPRACFRSVSGLILALFVTSVAVGTIDTIVDHRGGYTGGGAGSNLWEPLPDNTTALPDSLRARLATVPGVQAVVPVYFAPDGVEVEKAFGWRMTDLVSCAAIAGHADFGRCAPGAQVAGTYPDLTFPDQWPKHDGLWPTAHLPADRLAGLRIESLVVGTDGSHDAIERARTIVDSVYPLSRGAATEDDFQGDSQRVLTGWVQLANVVILTSLVIAGFSLAVSVVGGLSERKRPFSMLRLAGVPLTMLRRVVTLETAVPLLLAAVVAIGTGFVAAHLFLTAQMNYAIHSPGWPYYVIVVAGLAGCLGIVVSTMPLLRRITGPETARNE